MKIQKAQSTEIYGIIGLGRFGLCLGQELSRSGAEVMAIDCDNALVCEAVSFTDFAYVAGDYSKETLEQIGLKNCGVVTICIDDRLDQSLLTTLNVINLDIRRIIAKANSTEHGELLTKIGAEVVYPERDMGIRLAQRLQANTIVDTITLSNDIDIAEYPLPKQLRGKCVAECRLRETYSLNIIAIQRGCTTVSAITPDFSFEPNDIIVLIGKRNDMQRYEADMY